MPQHRVELMQCIHQLPDLFGSDAHGLGHILLAFVVMRQELVQGRVQQAHRARPPLERLEDADEVPALQRQQLLERPVVLGQRRL